jgi:hypothetical protein
MPAKHLILLRLSFAIFQCFTIAFAGRSLVEVGRAFEMRNGGETVRPDVCILAVVLDHLRRHRANVADLRARQTSAVQINNCGASQAVQLELQFGDRRTCLCELPGEFPTA